MNNSADAQVSREEEIAFLAMEQVLGVEIRLADAAGGDKMPDGAWVSADGRRRGIVEVTSPRATELMAEWARAKREARPQTESGSIPTRLNELTAVCNQMLTTDWGVENVEKLQVQLADERHLFLFGRCFEVQNYFYRLSDTYTDGSTELVEDLVLPEGITDVWFKGRARRDSGRVVGTTQIWLARYQRALGWQRYVVELEELDLPSPTPGIADDPVPREQRHPKVRTGIGRT